MNGDRCIHGLHDKFWVDSLLHLPNSPDFVSSDYHLSGPLKAIMMVIDTAECHAHICHTGGKANFTRHEHVLCVTRGRRPLTNVETRLKNNCATRNIIAKVCEMVTCPTCVQHALKSMRHWFLTASCIFQNDLHMFNLYNILFFCMLIPHSYLSGFLFLNNSAVCISHLHFQNKEDRFCFSSSSDFSSFSISCFQQAFWFLFFLVWQITVNMSTLAVMWDNSHILTN